MFQLYLLWHHLEGYNDRGDVDQIDMLWIYLQGGDGDMVIRANGHFQVDQTLLVQLLQQLPFQVTHQAPPWLAAILTCFQLLWT